MNRNYNSSPEYLSLLLDNSNEGVFACDNNFNITYRNKRMLEIHPYPQDVSPVHWPQYIQIMELDGITPAPEDSVPIMRALRGETVKDAYYILRRKDLSSILVKYNAKPLLENEIQIGALLTAEECTDLEQSKARFQAIFEQSPLSIQIVDKSGRTVLVNKAFRSLWSIPEEFVREFILKTYNILEDPVLEKAGELENIRLAFKGETIEIKEFLYDPSVSGNPGRARYARGLLYPLKDSFGDVKEVVIIHQDVTDHREAIESKERIFSQLEAIVREIPAGLMVTDKNLNVSVFNNQMKNMIGNSERAKEVFNSILKKSLKGETINSQEVILQNRMLAANAGPVHDSEGKITASILVSSDITENKRDESLRAFMNQVKTHLMSSIEYEKVIEKIALASIPFLADGCMFDIVEGNAIRRIITKHRDPYIQNLMDELQMSYPPKIDSPQPTARCIRTGQPEFLKFVDPEIVKMNTFDERHADLIKRINILSHIAVPLIVRGKTVGALNLFVGEGRPLFDEKDYRASKDLARHASVAIDNAQLYRDSKNAIQLRDDFISIASHELRTPITSLNLQLDVLTSLVEELPQEYSVAKLMHKFFGNTKAQLKRLTRLVDDMLDISRISTGKLSLNLKNVYMNQLVMDLLERFRDQLTVQNIEAKIICSEDVTLVCDPERMDQVITNFMTNAIRYGGKKPIHIHLEHCPNFVTIKVKDHGRGISKEDQERIFKRFERAHTDDDVNGLGLGLYINRQIVDEHQGKILVESEPGKGATFIVQIPKVRA